MNEENRIYAAIDLKSFYASVECVERGLDPLATNLVVADETRTQKTICLAVSPSLKSYNIPGRPRLFEVTQKVKEINAKRRQKANNRIFEGSSHHYGELQKNPSLELSYIVAPPRMKKYVDYSTKIYSIYLKYIAPEDIYVYSIDEVFIDLTNYLKLYKCSAKELTVKMVYDVFKTTGITATAGLGTNLFLAKVAMDIMAKKMTPDENGVRIAGLDEMSFRKHLWSHTPITDFWRVGPGTAKRLEAYGLYTMGDIALCSVGKTGNFYTEDLLYKIFGVNAELLIDHAWGWESCTIADIKAYKPVSSSLSTGQVLHCPYDYEKAKIIIKEMAEVLVRDLVKKNLATDQIVLTVGYDKDSLEDITVKNEYKGEVVKDSYGRQIPKQSHGSINLPFYCSSEKIISDFTLKLYEKIVNPTLLVRRVSIAANHTVNENTVQATKTFEQLDFFTDYEAKQKEKEEMEKQLKKEKNIQKAVMNIEEKYGKNAIIKGMNLQEGATTLIRNKQIGGHNE